MPDIPGLPNPYHHDFSAPPQHFRSHVDGCIETPVQPGSHSLKRGQLNRKYSAAFS
jgi:hypothetical protein